MHFVCDTISLRRITTSFASFLFSFVEVLMLLKQNEQTAAVTVKGFKGNLFIAEKRTKAGLRLLF